MPGTTPIPGDILEATCLCFQGNQAGINLLHYYVTSVTTPGATLTQIVTRMDGIFTFTIKPLLCNLATYRGVGLANVSGARTNMVVSVAGAGAGTGGATAVPTQVRGLISWYATVAAGPRYRGRSYIPFPPQAALLASGDPTAGYTAALANHSISLAGPIVTVNGAGSTTVQLCIAHRKDIPISAALVTVLNARAKFATQRKSGQYGRANVAPF